MPEIAEWLIPFVIFVARIFDVSLGTLRMIMVIAGHRIISAILGFVEVIIWIVAAGNAVEHFNNPFAVLAFAGGFAAGTLVGMTIENRLAIGFRVVRVINPKPELDLAGAMRGDGFTATRLEGGGPDGPVEIVFLAVKRRAVPKLLERIGQVTPDAFMSVERAERVAGFVFNGTRADRFPWGRFGQLRK
jgi:uncharacterized protein YebE (UPF0316 family)